MPLTGPETKSADPQGGRQSETQRRTLPAAADIAMCIVIFAFCIVVSFLAMTFEKAPDIFVGKGMQPRAFPLFLMVLIGVLNVILMRQTFKTPPARRGPIAHQTWITMALMLMFALVTTYADMMLAIALLIFIMSMLWGERRVWMAFLLAVLTPTVILLFFDLVLEVRFPRGWITNLYYN